MSQKDSTAACFLGKTISQRDCKRQTVAVRNYLYETVLLSLDFPGLLEQSK